MWQQITVYIFVAVAAIYLGRYLFNSVRSVIQARSGCGDGCDKCAFSGESKVAKSATPASAPGKIIPLTDIRVLPPRN